MAQTKIETEQLADNAVSTASIAGDAVTTAKIADNVGLGGNPTTTTQTSSDNTTKVATTAYVTTAIANLIDSAPGTMNTLNEIAAALNDDAAFNTTVTNAIAAKLPLAGGTLTGGLQAPNIWVDDDITHTGDSDTYLSWNADNLSIYNGGVQNAYLSPGYVAFNEAGGDVDFRVESNNSAHMLFVDGGTNRVGIGASGPTAVLDVRDNAGGDANTKMHLINSAQTTAGRETELIFGKDNGANIAATLKYYYHTTQANRRIDLFHYTTTKGISILNGGNVGIGQIVPTEALHIKTRDAGANIRLEQFDTSGAPSNNDVIGSIDWSINDDGNWSGADTVRASLQAVVESTSSGTGLRFFTGGNSAAAAEKMRINSSGNVGIGTASPGVALDVRASSGDGIIRAVGSEGNHAALELWGDDGDDATDGFQILGGANNDGLYFRASRTAGLAGSYAWHTQMFIDADSNNVGIGTQAPGQPLEILKSGGAKIRLSETAARYTEILGAASGSANGSTMIFSTIQAGGSTLTERMIINDTGQVKIRSSGGEERFILQPDTNANQAQFKMYGTDGSTERVHLDSYGDSWLLPESGQFGIGETSPTSPLHVKAALGNSSPAPTIFAYNTNGAAELSLRGGGDTWKFNTNYTANRLDFISDANTVMTMLDGGNVGINTTTPECAFVVARDDNQTIFRSDQGTASQRAGGGFHSIGHATQGSRLARFWLDADGANFSGSDYFYIQKTGGGDVDLILQNAASMKLATSGTTRMTIASDGVVETTGDIKPGGDVIMASGRGINFTATANSSGSMSSETLDDYEEGTWTPLIGGWTDSVTKTPASQNQGHYTKIGNRVFVNANVRWDGSETMSGGILIRGLPFTSEATVGNRWAGSMAGTTGITVSLSGGTYLTLGMDRNTTNIYIIEHSLDSYDHTPTIADVGNIYGLAFSYSV